MTESIAKQSAHTLHQAEDNEIDLSVVLNIIKHSYKLIVVTALVFLMMGVCYLYLRPPIYQSTAMIEMKSSGVSGALAMRGLMPGISSQTSPANLESTLLRSPFVLGDVVSAAGLDISTLPKYANFFEKALARFKHIQNSVAVTTLTVPNSLLEKPLTLAVQKGSRYTLSTANGKKILDGKIGQLESTHYLSEPFQIKVASIDAAPGAKFTVKKYQKADVAYRVASNLGITEEGSDTGVLRISYSALNPEQAQKLLNAVLAVAIEKNIQQKSEHAARLLQFISHQLPSMKNRLGIAEDKLDQYGFKTGVFNPKLAAHTLTENIDNLQKALEKLKFKKILLLQEYTHRHPLVIAITQKENELQSQINQLKAQLKTLPVTSQKIFGLQNKVKLQAGIYMNLLKNIQQMEMIKAGTVSSIQILSPASYPAFPVPVKRVAIVFGSILLGLIISLSIIFIKHVLSPVIDDPEVVEQTLGIPVLAIVPCSQKQMAHNKKVDRDKNYASVNPFLLAIKDAKDLSIESIRSLRTAIQMSLLDAKDNVIAISGCSPSIGKSFISSNLAVLMSDLGKRVLIIDTDMRLGKLCQSFGKAKAPGLATFLQNEANLDRIIQNIIPKKLDFISTGLYPNNPSELLSQKNLADLIQQVKHQYDLIIIDTPPILAVTDAALVLQHSSTNLLVLGVGKDQLKEVQHASRMLEKSGVKLTGIIFNTLTSKKSGSAYGYGKYNYHYAYEK